MSQNNTPSKTEIRIQYDDLETVEAVLQSITPDNMTIPEGMTLVAKTDGNSLIIKVVCEKSLGSLVSTLDDLLSCIQSAEKAIKEVQ